jgi:hypothetical protein
VPEVSRFFGMSILMYFNDHDPPHFHVRYNEYRAVFSISDLKMTDGSLTSRVVAMVLEWAFMHRTELVEVWDAIRERGVGRKIEPRV